MCLPMYFLEQDSQRICDTTSKNKKGYRISATHNAVCKLVASESPGIFLDIKILEPYSKISEWQSLGMEPRNLFLQALQVISMHANV